MRQLGGKFLQYMIYALIFPLNEQECYGTGKDFWCLDWWSIEVGKYFFEGEREYLRYPPARRLYGNSNFDKEKIAEASRKKAEVLKEIKEESHSTVIVFETCRGLDTLLVSTLKEWEKIYVVIDSEFEQVRNKVVKFLSDLNNVEIVEKLDELDKIKRVTSQMRTQHFSGRY